MKVRLLLIALLASAASPPAIADGVVTGQGRLERIRGRPEQGHVPLYESNLFLSPSGGGAIGPSRRLGAPPGLPATHDGFYSISAPAGSWSILLSQPLFFIRPKVVPDVLVKDGRSLTLHVEPAMDFSTWSTETWALPFASTWHQTFIARGTSITGVSWKLAGTNAVSIRASIHEDDGTSNPASWPQVSPAAARTDSVAAQADNWVRWRSGEVPTIPGRRYAVRLAGVEGGDLKFSPFNRAKDAASYSGGQAHDASGAPQPYDLHITVFSDSDGTAIPYARTTEGLGELRDGYYATRWGQTFRATMGSSLAAVDVWAAGADHRWDLDFTWTVRRGGPGGVLVAAPRTTRAAYQAFGAGLHGVSWNPGEVPLETGATYYVEWTNPEGFNPYVLDRPEDAYPDGAGYQDGALKSGGSVDVSMTIIVYLPRGGAVRGTVRDASSGRGLPGAQVEVSGLGRSALCAADGSYALREVPAGTWTLTASLPGFSPATRSGVVIPEGGDTAADFALERVACAFSWQNGGFEEALAGWTRYGKAKSSNPGAGWFGGIGPAEGTRLWGNEVNGAALGSGGAQQRFCAVPGHRYRLEAWSNIYWIEGTVDMARSRVGIHPSGGTVPDSTVAWSAWDRQPVSKREGWRRIAVEAQAAGPVMTVFLDFDQRDASSPPPGGQWRINAFDGVTVTDLDAGVIPRFERGDCNGDRSRDLADAVFLLSYAFLGGDPPACPDACDATDEGALDLSDAVRILGHLFLGGEAPPAPQGACGEDPTADDLNCPEFDCD